MVAQPDRRRGRPTTRRSSRAKRRPARCQVAATRSPARAASAGQGIEADDAPRERAAAPRAGPRAAPGRRGGRHRLDQHPARRRPAARRSGGAARAAGRRDRRLPSSRRHGGEGAPVERARLPDRRVHDACAERRARATAVREASIPTRLRPSGGQRLEVAAGPAPTSSTGPTAPGRARRSPPPPRAEPAGDRHGAPAASANGSTSSAARPRERDGVELSAGSWRAWVEAWARGPSRPRTALARGPPRGRRWVRLRRSSG